MTNNLWYKLGGHHPNIRAQAMLDDPAYPRPVGMCSRAPESDTSKAWAARALPPAIRPGGRGKRVGAQDSFGSLNYHPG